MDVDGVGHAGLHEVLATHAAHHDVGFVQNAQCLPQLTFIIAALLFVEQVHSLKSEFICVCKHLVEIQAFVD